MCAHPSGPFLTRDSPQVHEPLGHFTVFLTLMLTFNLMRLGPPAVFGTWNAIAMLRRKCCRPRGATPMTELLPTSGGGGSPQKGSGGGGGGKPSTPDGVHAAAAACGRACAGRL